MKKIFLSVLVLFLVSIQAFPPFSQGSDPFSRVSLSIKMRDGKYLAADLYTKNQKDRKPVILVQTPYNKSYYWTNLKEQVPFDLDFYHIVILDWRGRFGSSKAKVSKPDIGLDGYDAVEWIAIQPWSNGKIGTFGGSALGQVQYETAAKHPPHLVCAIPMIKDIGQAYETYYFGGEYRKEHTEALQTLQFLTTNIILSQPKYNLFWKYLEKNQDISSLIQVPMLLISGWFDHYPDRILRSYANLRAKSDQKVREAHKLIMGPWQHMTVGKSQQGALSFPLAQGYNDKESIRFMDYYLRGIQNGWDKTENIRYFQMGEDKWLSAKDWNLIPRELLSIYLNPEGKMDTRIPSHTNSSSSYVYDPNNPTKSYGGDRFTPGIQTISGPQDQREKVESRGDVLVFTSGILGNNLAVTGFIQTELYISSTMPDTDFSIRLCDVFPDGRSILMAEGIHRARFRNSLDKEEFLKKEEIVFIKISLQNIAHTFIKGHQIRIIVSSASYPIFERNPNTNEPLYKGKSLNIALNTVYHDREHLSRLILPRFKQ